MLELLAPDLRRTAVKVSEWVEQFMQMTQDYPVKEVLSWHYHEAKWQAEADESEVEVDDGAQAPGLVEV